MCAFIVKGINTKQLGAMALLWRLTSRAVFLSYDFHNDLFIKSKWIYNQ